MFLYIKVHLGQNPDFKALKDAGEEEPDEKWTREFWQELIQEKVSYLPDSMPSRRTDNSSIDFDYTSLVLRSCSWTWGREEKRARCCLFPFSFLV